MHSYFYDKESVRYRLASTHAGEPFNWLFFPGGPGADSCYLSSLLDLLKLPGNSWLIDLPGNGDNIEGVDPHYSYDRWFEIFPKLCRKFKNPIVVGHSFGAMLPLLNPEMEECLKGLVILHSAPSLWLQEAVDYAKQYKVPDLTLEMQEFTQNPNEQTFKKALAACMPYYFPASSLEKGWSLLKDVPFQYLPAVWAQRKLHEINYSAKWIPQKVPTLIISGVYDCIVPHTLFARDTRFHRPNIERCLIEDGGHLSWVENPKAVQRAFEKFSKSIR